jgi:putative ABC transport system permease protein
MISLRRLVRAYAVRLRTHPAQELLAGAGIAAGVALVFAVSIANSSITSSARAIMKTISGDAQLQLAAQGSAGADQSVVKRVRAIDGVEVAAPMLEDRATLSSGTHRVGVDLVGVDERLGDLGGMPSSPLLWGLLRLRGVFLPQTVGQQLDVAVGARVALEVRGRAQQVPVTQVLDERLVGALGQAMLAGASLAQVQQWTGQPGRISRVIVRADPERVAAVEQALGAIATDTGMELSTLDDELARLNVAVAPNDQATSLMAVVGVLVGLLLTATAMLLTLPERRRMVAHRQLDGAAGWQIAIRLLFPALVLGVMASAIGLLVGDLLAKLASQDPPGYLSFAFPLGVQRSVSWSTALAAGLGGVLVSLIAASPPLLDLRNDRGTRTLMRSGRAGHTIAARTRARLSVCAAAIVVVSTFMALLIPALTMGAVVLLAIAALLALPAIFALLVRVIEILPRRDRPSSSLRAARALRATTVRSVALAATAAIGVFGAIAIEGARGNLLTGLYEDYRDYVTGTDIWLTSHDDDLALQPLTISTRRLAEIQGVAAVRSYQGGLFDLGDRRIWMIARSPHDAIPIQPSQVLAGDLATATQQLRAGGAVTVSKHVADDLGVDVGDQTKLATPTGVRSFKVVAITTNLGWGPGAIITNLEDYRRAWGTTTPTAVQLDLRPGELPGTVIARVRDALGADASAVRVQTVDQRAAHAEALAREGLARLSQIATLLVIASAIALAAAMTAAIWQRRPGFAARSTDGHSHGELWRVVLLEAAITIAAGCVAGALAGSYGHWLLGRWLQASTGYPAPYDAAPLQLVTICGGVSVIALVIVALPGYLAVRAPDRLALDDSG